VVDLTCHNAPEQCQIVEDILADLSLSDKPRITVLNKIDLLMDKSQHWDEETAISYLSDQTEADENTVLISSTRGWGLNKLLELINRTLSHTMQPV